LWIGGGDTLVPIVWVRLVDKMLIQCIKLELLDKPTTARTTENPWPEWPILITTQLASN
jgi:hypothetical protein